MKKTIRSNARCALAAILSIMLLTALCGFAAVTANATAANADKQTTDYGTVDWSAAADGYITFTASGQECVFILQSPGGRRTSLVMDGGETVTVVLTDGAGAYQYAIGRCIDDGSACRVDYKDSFVVGETDTALAP